MDTTDTADKASSKTFSQSLVRLIAASTAAFIATKVTEDLVDSFQKRRQNKTTDPK